MHPSIRHVLAPIVILACAPTERAAAAPTVVVYNQTQSTVDGQPFLLKGAYAANPGDFARAAGYGFNVVQSYQLTGMTDAQVANYLDQAQFAGLKVLFNHGVQTTDQATVDKVQRRVLLFKDHPAMYAWYLADEPSVNSVAPADLIALYQWIKQTDPNHPVFSSNWELSSFKDACDVDMPQLYYGPPSRQRTNGPLAGKEKSRAQNGEPWVAIVNSYDAFIPANESLSPANLLIKNPDGTYKSGFTQAETNARIQAIADNLANPPYPTPQSLPDTPIEVRSQAIAMLAHGSNGIFYWLLAPENSINTTYGYYTFFVRPPLRDALTNVLHELDELWPRISGPAENASTWFEESGDVFLWYRRQGSQITIIAVNESENTRTVHTPIPSLLNQASINATVSRENRSVALQNGYLTDTFQPNEAHVYLIDGAGPDVETDGVWTNAAGGSWQTSGNWGGGILANGVGKTADFSTLNLTANATVALDGSPLVGTLKFGDATTASHDWTISSGGSLTLAGSAIIDVANRTTTIGAEITGQGFQKTGSGALFLSGANTYKNGTTVAAGSVTVSGDQSAANGGWIVKAGSATFQAGSIIAVASGKTVALDNTATGHSLNVSGVVTNDGDLKMGGASNLTIHSGGNWAQNGTMDLGPAYSYSTARITVNTGGTFTYSGNSAIPLKSSNAASNVTDKSIITLSGGNFVTGQGFHNSIVGGAGSASLEFSSGGTLKLTGDIATLATTADRPFDVQIGSGGGKIDTNGFAATITQGITNIGSQTGALTKQGAGTLTLSGSNSYTGGTIVEGGTLAVTGSLGTGAVEVKGTGTLNAGGNMGGAVTVRSNGHLAFAVAATSGAQTARSISGALTFDGGSVLDLTAAATPAVGTYVLANAASVSGMPGTVNLPAGMSAAVSVNGGSLQLTVYNTTTHPPGNYTGLQAWLKLDETSGTTAADTARAQDGTLLNSATWTSGIAGNAVALNGSNQSVQVPALNFSSNTVTISAWVKRSGPQVQWAGLVFERGLATGLDISLNNELRYRWNDTSVAFDFTSGLAIPDNTWTFCAVAVEPTKATLYLQPVGGLMQSAVNTATHASHTFNATAYLGQDSLGGRFFKGSLDDVRVYARALSAQEVSQLYDTAQLHAPVFAVNPMSLPAAAEDSAYMGGTLAGSASDPDAGDALTYAKASGPSWLNVAADGTLSGTPSNSDVGANSFTVRVTDNTGRTHDAVLNITVTNVNDAPAFTANPITKPNATPGNAYADTITGSATDVDAGDTLTYSKVSGPAWLGVAANGTLSGTPSFVDGGTNAFTVRVTDGGGLSADATLQITVSANGTWVNVNGGSWMAEDNWNSGSIASGSDNTANFGTLNLTTDVTATLDGARTIGNLVFGDTTPSHNWTLGTGSSGPLTLDVSSGTPSIGVNNQTATLSPALAGTKGLNKVGAGTLILTGTNTYSGTTAVSSGILQLGDGVTNGSINGPYTIASGATLRLARSAKTTVNTITGAGTVSLFVKGASNGSSGFQWDRFTTFNSGFSGKLVVEEGRVSYKFSEIGGTTAIEIQPGAQFLAWGNGTPTYPQSISIAGFGWGETGFPGGLRLAESSGTATWAGPVTLTADSGIMVQPNSTFHITGPISGNFQCLFHAGSPSGSNGTINVTPTGTVRNSYGSTKIDGKDTNSSIVAGNQYAFSAGGLTVANAAMKLNGFSFTFANLSGTGGRIGNYHASNAATLTVGNDNSDTTSATPMVNGGAAALALTKVGTGMLTLTGANTYTGATTLEAGTLAVTGSLGATAVEVKGTARLNAGGNFGGAVTVRSNGHLAFAVAASPGAQAARSIGGALTFDDGSVLDLTATATPAVGTYTLATASSISGVPSVVNLPVGMNGSVAVAGGSLTLTVVQSYATWIAAYNVGGQSAANDDADKDGIPNAVEFVLGTAPDAPNAATLQAQKVGSNFVFIFNRADASEQGNLQLSVEAGTSLDAWSQIYQIGATTAASTGGVAVTENGTSADTVTVSIPANGAPACFARLKVVTE